MIIYRTWNNTISEVEIAWETTQCIFRLDGRREAKRSHYTNYHATKEDAKAFLVDKATVDVKRAKDQLNGAVNRLHIAESL